MESTERVNTSLTCTWWAATRAKRKQQKSHSSSDGKPATACVVKARQARSGSPVAETNDRGALRDRETGRGEETQECQQIHKHFWLPRMGSGGVFSGSVTGW
jgi:hypothetical protein